MPRYYFHIRDGKVHHDDDGTEFPNAEAARREAVKTAAEMLRDQAGSFWDGKQWRMDVTDALGLPFFRLEFAVRDDPSSADP